jgi:hypothetical protein
MIEQHVAHVKARFGLPTYVSKRGDVLADCGGRALVASAREIAMNDPDTLWTARYRGLRHDTADYIAKGDWTEA